MTISDMQLQSIVDELAEQGYTICEEFLPSKTIQALATLAETRFQENMMQSARVGKLQVMLNQEIRGDAIDWLDENDTNPSVQAYFQCMQLLKDKINQQLWMNLHSLEAHLAVYAPGAFYKKHLDQFAEKTEQPSQTRQLSAVLYLNENWQESNAGALRLYLDESSQIDILPTSGRLVLFLSEKFWHEVLPANRRRISLTGWFRDRDTRLL
jgi:SM-20-related protein